MAWFLVTFAYMNLSLLPHFINHLLAEQPAACARLALHAGKVACIDAQLMTIRLQVRADGLLAAADPDAPPGVTIRVQAADIPLILQNRERAFSYVTLEGDADFANTLSQLSQILRWDAEADISRLTGDIAAVRIVGAAKAAIEGANRAGRQFAENVSEYLLEENPMLVRPAKVAAFGSDVMKLRDDVERMIKRIEKLEGRR